MIAERQKGSKGMIKLKVSYRDKEELEHIVKLLGTLNIKSLKKAKNQEGQFKKAYIIMREAKR